MKLRSFLVSLLFPLALLSGLSADGKFSLLIANAAENLRNDVIGQIREKVDKGASSAADFAPELKKLDEHAATYAAYPELAADFALVKAGVYLDAINDRVQGRKMLLAIGRDYAGTPAAEQAAQTLVALDKDEQRAAANGDLQPLVEQVAAKAKAGSRDRAAYATELAKLDALRTKYADNREAAANVALAKALLYLQVLGDTAQAKEQFVAITTGYSGTLAAATAQQALDELK